MLQPYVVRLTCPWLIGHNNHAVVICWYKVGVALTHYQ